MSARGMLTELRRLSRWMPEPCPDGTPLTPWERVVVLLRVLIRFAKDDAGGLRERLAYWIARRDEVGIDAEADMEFSSLMEAIR